MKIVTNALTSVSSAINQRLLRAQAWAFGNQKHDYYKDYGYPETVTFELLYRMYSRGGLATAAVDKTTAKTWETNPKLWESNEPTDSPIEAEVARHFARRRIWSSLMNTDRRSMVGDYAGAIVLLRDSKKLDEPVERVPGGLEGLKGVIPAWEGQLAVAEWETDPDSENFGEPKFYQYNEQAVDGAKGGGRGSVRIHPDRVLIFSEDGTVNGRSLLEPGFNDLIDAEKVKGAGGEGFWKSARGAPIIEAPQGVSPDDVRRGMGAGTNDEVIDKLNEQVNQFQAGFDSALMLGGFNVKPLTITLPKPKEFWETAVMSFAASIQMPFKVLVGNITGERASTEDARDWAKTNMSRRENEVIPILNEFVARLVAWGILPAKDWVIGWDDLTEATAGEKIDRAAKMAEINAKLSPTNELAFLPDEIRETAGFKSADEVEGFAEFLAERAAREEAGAEDTINEEEDTAP